MHTKSATFSVISYLYCTERENVTEAEEKMVYLLEKFDHLSMRCHLLWKI